MPSPATSSETLSQQGLCHTSLHVQRQHAPLLGVHASATASQTVPCEAHGHPCEAGLQRSFQRAGSCCSMLGHALTCPPDHTPASESRTWQPVVPHAGGMTWTACPAWAWRPLMVAGSLSTGVTTRRAAVAQVVSACHVDRSAAERKPVDTRCGVASPTLAASTGCGDGKVIPAHRTNTQIVCRV